MATEIKGYFLSKKEIESINYFLDIEGDLQTIQDEQDYQKRAAMLTDLYTNILNAKRILND